MCACVVSGNQIYDKRFDLSYFYVFLFRYFKIYELEAEADFPEELSKFEEVSNLLIR